MITWIQNFFWGIFFALGELIPGVGLQTVAIIAGLYDDMIGFLYQGTEFLRTIGLFILGKAQKNDIYLSFIAIKWSFGLPIFVGLVLTIVALSHTVSSLFESYPTQISAISFGIVLACVFIPYKEMTDKTWKEWLVLLASFAAFFGLFSIQVTKTTADPSLLTFFGGGLLASVAGFFPGISISLALLMMGLYNPLLMSVDAMTSGRTTLYAFLAVLLFIIGLVIGMIVFVRVLSLVIDKYKSLFLAFIIGLIVASLRAIWPFTANGGTDILLPWEVSLPQFTQQLIFIILAFISVTIARKLAENKGTLASSFGPKERMVIAS